METEQKYFRISANVSLDAVRDNITKGKKLLKPGTKLMAVVKADAYGHGAVPIAKAVDDLVDAYAVAPGTRGTVDHVDDMGSVHIKWDNGRTLAAIPGVDSFRKLTGQELQEERLGMTAPKMEGQSL